MRKYSILNRHVLIPIVGNCLEFYEFTVFMFLTPLIAKEFFPSHTPFSSILFTISIFATGFFMRPLGAIYFGYIGDKYGRQKALSYSILLMSIPTFLIGVCPNYAHIGIFAPFCILCLRLFQGFCAGGEYSGAAIYAVENNDDQKSGYIGGLITSSCILGSLSGSIISLILSFPHMPEWSWRIAFLLGSVGGIIGYRIRLKGLESDNVRQELIKNRFQAVSFLQAVKTNSRAALCVFGIAGFSGCVTYTCFSYISLYLVTFKQWDKHLALAITSIGMIVYMIFAPFFGYLSDKYGGKIIMITGALTTILFIYPCFYALSYANSFMAVLFVQLLLSIAAAIFQGPMNGFMSKLFSVTYRYRGIAISYCTGMALFGGTASSILMLFSGYTNQILAPFLYISFVAALGISATYFSRENYLVRSSI
jgi:MHS family proline/betaine transporter-like MFS transporter